MAEFKSLSGVIGAGVVGGALYVGTTDADATEITATGFIPWSVGIGLQKGDGIVMNYMETSGDPATIRSDFFVVGSNSSNSITLQIFSGYGGSGLGNTPAGFNRTFLSGNIGAGSDAPSVFAYNNAVDDMDDIAGADYFNDASDILREGDFIYVTCAAGAGTRGADLVRVDNISSIGEVAVLPLDFSQKA